MIFLLYISILDFWVNFAANILTIIASTIAIILFWKSRKKISNALNAIINYSNQITLTELRFKIQKAQGLNANIGEEKEEILNILHDIAGQILGSSVLKRHLDELRIKIEEYNSDPKLLNEATKRRLLSELNETLRHVDLSNYNDIIE